MVPDSHRISQANEALGRLICSGRGLPVWHGCLLVTASGESHPALKQNSSSTYCMREISKLQPLFRKSSRGEGGSSLGPVLRADGGERASLAGAGKSRARYAQRDGRLLGERLPVIVCLTWAKRAGNTYRVSFGCRNADAIAMNIPRRLCGTMPPTHVSHPPTSFLCSCCTETGHICSFFEGEDPRPRTRTLPLPVVLGVKGLPVSLRRRRVLCTLPILQPCALRHALHC